MIRRALLLSLAAPLLSSLVACASGGDLTPDEAIIVSAGGSSGASGDGEGGEAGEGQGGDAGESSAGAAGSGEAGTAGEGGGNQAGNGGSSGDAGSAGTAGEGGSAGTAGNGGSAAEGGSGGSAGEGASGSAGNGGSAGAGGSSGTAGNGGSAGEGGSGGSGGGSGITCAPLEFISGVKLVTKPDAAFTAEYEALNAASCVTPLCFIDALDLRSPSGETYDVHVKLAKNFELYELIATEVDPLKTKQVDVQNAYSTKVLVSPELIAYLQDMRDNYGGAVNINSGYRSPKHQAAVCQEVCGADQCADPDGTVTCAKLSRHMWGTAADMDLKYEAAAKAVDFPFVFHENGGTGPHLHVDTQSCN